MGNKMKLTPKEQEILNDPKTKYSKSTVNFNIEVDIYHKINKHKTVLINDFKGFLKNHKSLSGNTIRIKKTLIIKPTKDIKKEPTIKVSKPKKPYELIKDSPIFDRFKRNFQ